MAMVYKISEKKEAAAPEILYGKGAMRYSFELQHTQINGAPDNMTSTFYVDKDTFSRFTIGDRIELGINLWRAPIDATPAIESAATETGLELPAADHD